MRCPDEASCDRYGLALWCGLDWKDTYVGYMQLERKRQWSEKQIAFVGLLFGVAQGVMPNWIGHKCEEEDRAAVEAMMTQEKARIAAQR